MCEYWDSQRGRWVQADPQMDPFQQSFLKLSFSPQDMPLGAFWVAGEAWQKCRSGEIDPQRCGISCDPKLFGLESLYGLWFTRGQLLRDFAALNKVETVPFLVRLSEEDYRLLDRIAELSVEPDRHFAEIRELYETTPALQPPEEIISR